MKFKALFFIFLFPLFAYAQSPWTPGKGKQYHQLSFTTVPAYDKLFVNVGEFELERFVTDNTLQYYGEIGLSNHFSLTAIIPLKLLKSGDLSSETPTLPIFPSGNFTALGNVQLAAKYNFYNINDFAFSASMQVGTPSDANQKDTGLRSGFDAWSLSPSLSAGVNKEKFYSYSFLAYSWYSNEFASYIHFGIEAGAKLNKGLIIAIQISTLQTLTDGTYIPSEINLRSGLYLNGYEYTAFLIKVIKDLIPNKFGINGSLGGGTGNLVAQSPALTFGAYFKL